MNKFRLATPNGKGVRGRKASNLRDATFNALRASANAAGEPINVMDRHGYAVAQVIYRPEFISISPEPL